MNELQRNKKAPWGIWYSLLMAGKISQGQKSYRQALGKQNPKDTKDKVVIAGRVTLEILEVVFLHEILTYLEHFKNNPAKDSQRRGRNHIIPSEVRENGIDYFMLFIKIFKIYISIF